MSEEQLEQVVKEVDLRGNGVINYHDFIAATFPVEQYASKERLEALFAKFDVAGTHQLTGTTLRDAFTKLGHNMTSAEIEEVMNEHDIDHQHQISYKEFQDMILDHIHHGTE